jgi:hypothetical protein
VTGRRARCAPSLLRATARFLVVCLACLALPPGCAGGTETGNPSIVASLSYTAYSTKPAQVSVREASGGAVVKTAWLVLGNVAFDPSSRCGGTDTDDSTRFAPGIGVGNHASGKAVTVDFDLPSDEYCAVDLPFVEAGQMALPAEAPPEILTNTIVLTGELADGTPFTVVSGANPVVHLTADGGHFAMNDAESGVLVAFDVATWLGGIDWASAAKTDGKIVISASQNPELLASFESQLAAGVDVYRDADKDGFLDPSPERLAHGE